MLEILKTIILPALLAVVCAIGIVGNGMIIYIMAAKVSY